MRGQRADDRDARGGDPMTRSCIPLDRARRVIAWGCLLLAAVVVVPRASAGAASVVSLAGVWRFDLDPSDVGLAQRWFARDLDDTVRLPGSTDENAKGHLNTRSPDFNGLSRVFEYVGPAWYQRDIQVPEAWRGKRVVLFLERCHWETRVWLDDRECGTANSLCVPHEHELGTDLAPGRHRLTIRVDNTLKLDMGGAAHSTSEQTQTNWNGIIGRLELRATPRAWIADLQVYPEPANRSAQVKATLRGEAEGPVGFCVSVAPCSGGRPVATAAETIPRLAGARQVELELRLGARMRPWDEFAPNLYALTATLAPAGEGAGDRWAVPLGLRDLRAQAQRLTLNGRHIYLRGTLECCVFPRTGYPAMEVDAWLRILRIARSYGLNHLRFHSWCPPEAAFAAADRMGFLLHVEAPQWVGNAGYDEPRDAFIAAEVERILDTYGNHPSFGMLCLGNELGGRVQFIQDLVDRAKAHDPRHLYTSSTAWSFTPSNDYNVAVVRGLWGPMTIGDYRGDVERSAVPLVSHEVGQWTVFPNLAEIPKYTGVLKPRNFELVRESLRAHHLLDQAPAFTSATGKLAAALYKEEIEILLRTPCHSGFQLLDLHDFPGQGTALVGLLDAFWDSKGVIEPGEFRRFCGPTVPLLRMPKRVYTTNETFEAGVQVAHFGPTDLEGLQPRWTVREASGRVVASGALPVCTLRTGDLHDVGTLSFPLKGVAAPSKVTVTVALPGTSAANDWEVWVYPEHVDTRPPEGVVISRTVADAIEALDRGRRVLLLASRWNLVDPRPGSFRPVFWSPVWFRDAARGTMSILCDPSHPAFAAFPTDAFTNWQWYDLLQHSSTMHLGGTPSDFRPLVQVIDNFTLNEKLGSLLEARFGAGRLMVCSLDLSTNLAGRPAARQLLHSLLQYVSSDAFLPRHGLSLAQLSTFLCDRPRSVIVQLGGLVRWADSEDTASGNVAANAIDGDPNTFWHTQWVGGEHPPFPHEIQIDLERPTEISGIRYLPRQDMRNGRFTEYALYVSDSIVEWGAPVASGRFEADAQEKVVAFPATCGRYLRLVALRGLPDSPWAAIAELDIIRP